jgi:predicted Fe-S protein YdhL (DUF1289 family)
MSDQHPPSPCIQVCTINAASGLCLGCWRSLEEIGTWSSLSAAQQRAIIADLPQRAEQLFTAGDTSEH